MVEKTVVINTKHGPFDAAFIVGDVFSDAPTISEDEAQFLSGDLQSKFVSLYLTQCQ